MTDAARRGRRALPWVVAAALAAVGMVAAQLQPGWTARHPRFEVGATVGERVTTSDVSLKVTHVTVAKTLTQQALERSAYTSPGVYVVVHLTGHARYRTISLRNSVLRDAAGHRYIQSDGGLETFASSAMETHVPLTGTLVFAVPRRALGHGLELVAVAQDGATAVEILFNRPYAVGLDDPAVVPLGTSRKTRVRKTFELPAVEFA